MRKPATVAARSADRVPVPGAETAEWLRLVEAVRANPGRSAAEFKERYRNGVLMFLRRQVGVVGISQLVEEALDGAVREITANRLASPGDLVHFLRNVLERELLIRNLDPARSLVALSTAVDHDRISRQAGEIKEALAGFSEMERRALEGYYEGNLSAEQAAQRVGLAPDGFTQLRERLYEAVRLAGLRKGPRQTAEPASPVKARAMAANSGGVAS